MKKSVEDRFEKRRKNSEPESLPPITLREVADVTWPKMAKGPPFGHLAMAQEVKQ